MTVFREISISDQEVAALRAVEQVLRAFNDALGNGSELGLYADDLHTIARRYERVDELEAIRAEALAQPLSFKLHSITGGAA